MNRPNILYIMSDDHSSNAISCYHSILEKVFQTPNIDRIAVEGCRMDAYCATNAVCTPARASIMTGQYGHINGVKTLDDDWNPQKGPDLAKLLQNSGYQTALFGKWHLGCVPEGFDTFQYLSKGNGKEGEQGDYYDPCFQDKNGTIRQYDGYVTDIITDMTKKWLENRDKERPFFVMCHHKAPHDFWEYHKRYEDLFQGVDIPVPDSLFEDRKHRSLATRDFGSSVTPRSRIRSLYCDFCRDDYVTGKLEGTEGMSFEEKGIAAYQKYLKDYLRTVAAIDESVGQLITTLEEDGSLENTIVIYTSDQGMFLGEHDYQDKRWSFEESLRTPFLIRYPKEIQAGSVCKALMANIDVAPTLLDYAGIEIPEEMQGVSGRKVIAGEEKEIRDAVYFRYWMHLAHNHDNPAHYGIRTKRYKLTFYYGLPLDATGAVQKETPPGWELYDLERDPQELHNVYEDIEYQEVCKRLKVKLENMKKFYRDTDEEYPVLLERYKRSK